MPSDLRLVLVHLDPMASTPRRLALARQVAQEHGAELHALYVCTPGLVELPYAPESGGALFEALLDLDNDRRAKVLKAFDKEMTQPGPMATWAQTDEFPIAPAFAQQALYADLLVLGQYDATDDCARSIPPDFVENVLVASGRPALVLPSIGFKQGPGEVVAIAWKETPEAARAVHAALPFLQRAREVHVFAWSEEGTPRIEGPGLDLGKYLKAHGIAPTWHHGGTAPERLGEQLLSSVFDVGADLLVMGCYGHSRAREWVLGGVSRTLLASMTLPVLMSH